MFSKIPCLEFRVSLFLSILHSFDLSFYLVILLNPEDLCVFSSLQFHSFYSSRSLSFFCFTQLTLNSFSIPSQSLSHSYFYSSRLIATYENDTSNNVVLHSTGTDGLEGLKAGFSQLTAGWGFLRMSVGNDELSKRAKFVFITWCGPGIKVMRKARLSVHIADIKKTIRVCLTRFDFLFFSFSFSSRLLSEISPPIIFLACLPACLLLSLF